VTLRSAHDFQQYAGAFTVTASEVPFLRPGMMVEFVRYSGPEVWMYDVETGNELVEPASRLSVAPLAPDRWRVLRDSEMLLEVEAPPAGYRQRDFLPPRGYGLLTRFIRPRVPWPDPPEWLSLEEIIRLDRS
jgi:hypothetical protein